MCSYEEAREVFEDDIQTVCVCVAVVCEGGVTYVHSPEYLL